MTNSIKIALLTTENMCVPSNVYFPPRNQCDFIIHYGGTNFHVHKYLMTHHSVVLQNYLDVTSCAPSESECEHDRSIRCIHISPIALRELQETNPSPLNAEAEAVTHCSILVMQHFLSYLYFRNELPLPPLYRVDTDLQVHQSDMGTPFAPWPVITNVLLTTPSIPRVLFGILSVAHYLDCPILMERMDNVLSVACVKIYKDSMDGIRLWLGIAERFHLKRTTSSMICAVVDHLCNGADPRRRAVIMDQPEWKAFFDSVSRPLLIRMFKYRMDQDSERCE